VAREGGISVYASPHAVGKPTGMLPKGRLFSVLEVIDGNPYYVWGRLVKSTSGGGGEGASSWVMLKDVSGAACAVEKKKSNNNSNNNNSNYKPGHYEVAREGGISVYASPHAVGKPTGMLPKGRLFSVLEVIDGNPYYVWGRLVKSTSGGGGEGASSW
ncbi:unnamed protein product, partial [Polarella glacialis]